jgi:very-short-patch-repair endonuclease
MNDERRIYQLTATQHGVATRAQLHDIGITDGQIRSGLAKGRLERMHRGAYRVGGTRTTPQQRALGACLAVDGLVAASHRSAAGLWGIELEGADLTEISVATSRSARLAPGPSVLVHRSVDLTCDQVIRRAGVPVTDPMRTLVDLGAVVRATVVEDALDDLVGRKVVTVRGVRSRLERLAARGRSGGGVLREVLDRRTVAELTMSRSRLEALLRRLCRDAGLPDPVFQHPVRLGGRNRRIDFAFPELMIAIEVDGYESHSRYDVFEDDRVRGNDLELAGWTVLRFTWHQLTQRPDYVVAVLRAALAHAAAA